VQSAITDDDRHNCQNLAAHKREATSHQGQTSRPQDHLVKSDVSEAEYNGRVSGRLTCHHERHQRNPKDLWQCGRWPINTTGDLSLRRSLEDGPLIFPEYNHLPTRATPIRYPFFLMRSANAYPFSDLRQSGDCDLRLTRHLLLSTASTPQLGSPCRQRNRTSRYRLAQRRQWILIKLIARRTMDMAPSAVVQAGAL